MSQHDPDPVVPPGSRAKLSPSEPATSKPATSKPSTSKPATSRPSFPRRTASGQAASGSGGCREYGTLSRRRFLGWGVGGLGAAVASAALPALLPRVALGTEGPRRDVLVSIFLRGGADGLTLCVPHFDDAYYALRPTLAVPRPDAASPRRAVDLDGRFGLPPAMAALAEPFADGHLAIVHACGLEGATRSHFDAMRFVEVGMGGAPFGLGAGWIGRHLQDVPPVDAGAVLRAVALDSALPRSLAGAPSSTPVPDPTDYGILGPGGDSPAWQERLWRLYDRAEEPLSTSALTARQTAALLRAVDVAGYRPAGGVTYPEDELGQALRSTAALIRAGVGLEVASIDVGGWDTHEAQGPFEGDMASLMASLSTGLVAFYRDLWSADQPGVVVVVQSEFGRNAFENGSAGTDHGHGGALFVLGGSVVGGRVLGTWPGLEPEQLYEGQDLATTTDYRDVLSEILARRLDNPAPAASFADPDYAPRPVGLFDRG